MRQKLSSCNDKVRCAELFRLTSLEKSPLVGISVLELHEEDCPIKRSCSHQNASLLQPLLLFPVSHQVFEIMVVQTPSKIH